MSHPLSLRPMAFALALASGMAAHGQSAFQDSMARIASRIVPQLEQAGRTRVAVTGISDPGGELSAATITYVEEVLIMRLSEARGLRVVERRQLDHVLEEHHRSLSGPFDEKSAVELGRLLSAEAIVTGRLFPVGRRLHVMLRALDTETGVLIGTAETITAMPSVQEPRRTEPVAGPEDGRSAGPPADRHGVVEFRAHGLWASYFGHSLLGGTLETMARSLERHGDRTYRGRVSIGLQVTAIPSVLRQPLTGFDIGHVSGIQGSLGMFTTPTVRIGGADMGQGRLFLMASGQESLAFDPVTSAADDGIERLQYERHRLSDLHMHMLGFNLPLRCYLGRQPMRGHVPKLYLEVGFGMDLMLVNADYEVTSTVVELDRSNYTYATRTERFTGRKPSIESVGRDMWFSHFSAGGGFEVGRFNVYALGRFLSSSKFTLGSRGFDRLRGNILAYPFLTGAQGDARAMSDLALNGAVPYGAIGLERERTADSTGNTMTVTGNGVDRFWIDRHLVLGIAYRFR